MLARDDRVADAPTIEAVAQVILGQHGGRRHHHRAQLAAAEHRFPQRRHVAQQQQHAVTAAHAQAAQVVGDPVGPLGQGGEADRCLVLAHEAQRGSIVAGRHAVEMIQGEVEMLQNRPAERGARGLDVGAMRQQ